MPFMNILHIISQRPDSTGSGFYLQNLIRLAAGNGHRNYLIAGAPAGTFPELDCIEKASCTFVGFEGSDLDYAIPGMSDVMPYRSSVFSELSCADLDAYERAFADKIQGAAEAFRPDIIHSHHLWMVTAVARRVLPAIPMVTSCHSTDLRQFMKCTHLRERVLDPCRQVQRVLALSHDQSEKIGKLYGIAGSRIDIVGGGYDEDLFTWCPKASSPPVHLLYAGKLSFAKGVDWLLRTCRRLTDLPLHVHLAGSGAGVEAEECLALAQVAGVKVTVHGGIGQRELSSLMQSCHIFVLPSFYEGLPLVLLEALASGCRIITTDLPGCRELLAKGSPDLVEFIRLPGLRTVDRPYGEDMERLEVELALAIGRTVERVMSSPSPDQHEVASITQSSGWKGVFQKVLNSYRKAIGHSA